MIQNNHVYFDIAATTPIDELVSNHMHEINKNIYGNPSSVHQLGQKAHNIIARSRKKNSNFTSLQRIRNLFYLRRI